MTNKEIYEVQNCDIDIVSSEAIKSIKEYKKTRKINTDVKIFKVLGLYSVVRDYLNQVGMVEMDWEPKFPK